mmetsp:Transcript_209/g.666  ORF Transcript_209/g.666 Transcript_209/m.666 type:complete len:264 (-) Transcript_209:65-856(-)
MRRAAVNKAAALAKLAQRRAEAAAAEAEARGELPALSSLVVEKSWAEALAPQFEEPYFKGRLTQFVHGEWAGRAPVYPPKPEVFRAFNACPFGGVKVVILGQDPYHGPGQAMGLCFGVNRGVPLPPSLRNIYQELRSDVGCEAPAHGDLTRWAAQGVLLLNTCLTVRRAEANSHAKRGWEAFTDAAIRAVSRGAAPGVVFVLWGKPAQEKRRLIDCKRHHVLEAPHPSPLSAHRGFFGTRPFTRANELLMKGGREPVDWALDP